MKCARHGREGAGNETATRPIVERGPHPSKRRWKKREVALLGKVADEVLARRLRITHHTVLYERRRRGIAPFRPRRPDTRWTRRMLELLGQDTDRAVAAEFGLSEAIVQRKRQLSGIPPFAATGGRKRSRPWTRQEISLLGTASDREVAKRLRVSVTAVARRRGLLGIAPFRPAPSRFRWTKGALRRLGREPDGVVAERLGISAKTVRAKRVALGIAPLAGDRMRWVVRKRELREIAKLPVAEACRRFGLSNTTVAKIRAELGLGLRRWNAAEERLLGSAPDREVAKLLDRSLSAVQGRRYKLGIRRFRGGSRGDRVPHSDGA